MIEKQNNNNNNNKKKKVHCYTDMRITMKTKEEIQLTKEVEGGGERTEKRSIMATPKIRTTAIDGVDDD